MSGMELALFGQVLPPISDATAITIPLVVLLLGAAAAIGESRWRVANAEKRMEAAEARLAVCESRVGGVEAQLGTAMAILGRVEKGVEDIQRELREAFRRSA